MLHYLKLHEQNTLVLKILMLRKFHISTFYDKNSFTNELLVCQIFMSEILKHGGVQNNLL